MASRRHYILTHHVRERFIQRTNKKFNHLDGCQKRFCNTCDELLKKIHHEILYNLDGVNAQIYDKLDLADEDRSYVNNTMFMNWYYEKYGYDRRFELLVHDDIVFVVIFDQDKKIVVTCLRSKTHFAGKRHIARPRFNKLTKKSSV